uniref:hypothetical protein n=1 Tax=Candidatus Electronema sp. TaxID=2698783 RepID=UPI004055EEFB
MNNKIKIAALWLIGKIVAIFVFTATMLLSFNAGNYLFMAIFFPAQTDFTKGVPDNFLVVMEERVGPGDSPTFRVRHWREEEINVPELAKEHPEMFRLSVRESPYGGRWFTVLEESAQHQVIEVQHDNTYKMRLRYRISGRSITPLYYKIDASMGLVIYLLPIFIFSVWLGWFTSRRSVRWVKPAIEAVRSNASQKL